jgi:RAT1-interacting protein
LLVLLGLTLESADPRSTLVSPDHSKHVANTLEQEIACFSYDDKHQFRLDASSLRYYYPPYLPADLNKGFDTFQQLDDTIDDHLDGLVDTIAALEKEKGAKVETDIITWRGMMTKV